MDIFNEAIAFGITPFETIYFEDKLPQRLISHYNRLKRASSVFKCKFNKSFSEFDSEVKGFLNSSKKELGVLKIILLDGKLNFKIRDASYNKALFEKGLKLNISKVKNDENNIFTYFKTLNYGKNILENKRATKKGYNTCLILNNKNEICETSYANIFFRRGNIIYTPDLRCGILPGVMRKDILEFCMTKGYKVEKIRLLLKDIDSMEEAFISSSVSSAFPIKIIDKKEFISRDFVNKIKNENKFKRPWNN